MNEELKAKYTEDGDKIYCSVQTYDTKSMMSAIIQLGRKYPNHELEIARVSMDPEHVGHIYEFILVPKREEDEI